MEVTAHRDANQWVVTVTSAQKEFPAIERFQISKWTKRKAIAFMSELYAHWEIA